MGGDEDIRATTSAGMRALLADLRERSGADEPALRSFFATGMMLNVATLLRLDEISTTFE